MNVILGTTAAVCLSLSCTYTFSNGECMRMKVPYLGKRRLENMSDSFHWIEREEKRGWLTVRSGGIISGMSSVQLSLLMNSIVFCSMAMAD